MVVQFKSWRLQWVLALFKVGEGGMNA